MSFNLCPNFVRSPLVEISLNKCFSPIVSSDPQILFFLLSSLFSFIFLFTFFYYFSDIIVFSFLTLLKFMPILLLDFLPIFLLTSFDLTIHIYNRIYYFLIYVNLMFMVYTLNPYPFFIP